MFEPPGNCSSRDELPPSGDEPENTRQGVRDLAGDDVVTVACYVGGDGAATSKTGAEDERIAAGTHLGYETIACGSGWLAAL